MDDRCVDVVIRHDTPALVYALTHARCESLAERLSLDAFQAAPYHAGLPARPARTCRTPSSPGGSTSWSPPARSAWASTNPTSATVVHAGVPGEPRRLLPGDRPGRPRRASRPAAVLVHDPRTIRIPRSLAARTHLGEATVHSIVDAIENAGWAASPSRTWSTPRGARPRRRPRGQRAERTWASSAQRTAATGWSNRDAAAARRPTLTEQLMERGQAAPSSAGQPHGRGSRVRGDAPAAAGPNCWRTSARPTRRRAATATTTRRRGRRRHLVRRSSAGCRCATGSGAKVSCMSHDDHELLVYFDSVGYKHLTASALKTGILERG